MHQSGSGWSPVYVQDNLAVMSIGAWQRGVADTTKVSALGMQNVLVLSSACSMCCVGNGQWVVCLLHSACTACWEA